MEKNQICRMKTDGSGYEVLGWGQTLSIYKDKIYYIKNKVVTDVYGSSTEAVGIAKMDLKGKNKKDIKKTSFLNISTTGINQETLGYKEKKNYM